MGNLGSIQNMLRRIGEKARITSDPAEIRRAPKLLLPGVGSFDAAMQRIERAGLREVLDEKALDQRVPVLGICLGMQLLTRGSEEGQLRGLGWINAECRRFPSAPDLKVPHMGWNEVRPTRASALTEGLPPASRFYFVHSYYVAAKDDKDPILKATYGTEFDAALEHGNVFGAQFHPEKSHKFGMHLLSNFARL